MNFLVYFCCCRSRDRMWFHSKLVQAEKQLERVLDLEKFVKQQRMNTLAIFGLLNRNQLFYASKMSQLVASNDYRTNENCDSDSSFCEDEQQLANSRQTKKSIFTDKIAKDLAYSRDKVDRRLLKIHKMAKQPPSRRTKLLDLLEYLGVQEHIKGAFQSSSSETDKKGVLLSNGSIKEQSHSALNESNGQKTVQRDV